ncbi:unnamed protein product [Effrenium voratum]|nr:unnamed protein product [Effrenium voratum]
MGCLTAAESLEEAEAKAREAAEEAKESAEASLGRLGIELVRLQSREALLLEECASRRGAEETRAKQTQDLRALRQSASSERQRREELEASSREQMEAMRKELARSRSELEELRPECTQEKWRKQRAIERENRQLRERLLALQDAEGDLRRLRVELRDASQKGEEEKEVAARVQREQRQGRLSQAEALKTLRQQLASEQGELKEHGPQPKLAPRLLTCLRLRQQLMSCEAHALRLSEGGGLGHGVDMA